MQANKEKKEGNTTQASRRSRVNRLKSMILIGAAILLFTSVILNFALVIKVLHLENQIDKLYSDTQVFVTQDTM